MNESNGINQKEKKTCFVFDWLMELMSEMKRELPPPSKVSLLKYGVIGYVFWPQLSSHINSPQPIIKFIQLKRREINLFLMLALSSGS